MTENIAEASAQEKIAQQEPAPAAAPEERLLKQSEVNKIVGDAKVQARQEAYQRGQMDALQRLKDEAAQQQPAAQGPAVSGTPNQGVAPTGAPNQINQAVDQRLQALAMQKHHQDIANQFVAKLEAGKAKYPDWDAKIAALKLPDILPVVHLTNSVDNTADVIADLMDNPHKVGELLTLAEKAPHLAMQAIQNLSGSIKANMAAKDLATAKEPLSQPSPSTMIGADSGPRNAQSWRKDPRLKG